MEGLRKRLALSLPALAAGPLPAECRPGESAPGLRQPGPQDAPDRAAGTAMLARLPLAFVENQGQWDTPAKFVARRGGLVARIEPDALVLHLTRRDGDDRIESVVVRLAFEGALETVVLEGESPQPGLYNFFLGNDPSRWRTHVLGYKSILYRGLHEGVDLRVREEEGRLEYDLILAPGADLDGIVVRCEGTEGLEVEADGSLAMKTALGPLRHSPPRTWQVLPGGGEAPVDARFHLLESDRFTFEVPRRDPFLALVIDPGLVYSTYLGGTGADMAFAIALDSTGAATVAGSTSSSDFPTTAGAYDPSLGGTEDAFLARLSPSGGSLVYSTFVGGSDGDGASALALDATGAATFAGFTGSSNFPTTTGAYDPTFNGVVPLFADAFVARLSPTGSSLVYSTFIGGSTVDLAFALALDNTGAAAVAGLTDSSGFPTTAGPYNGGSSDAFVARLSLSGNGPADLLYSTFLARLYRVWEV